MAYVGPARILTGPYPAAGVADAASAPLPALVDHDAGDEHRDPPRAEGRLCARCGVLLPTNGVHFARATDGRPCPGR